MQLPVSCCYTYTVYCLYMQEEKLSKWIQCYGFHAFNAPNHHLWILYYLETIFHFILWISYFQCSKSPPMYLIWFENNVPFYHMDSCTQRFKSLPMNLILFENNLPFYPMDFILSMLQMTTYGSYMIWKQCSILSYGIHALNASNHYLWILYYLKTMFHFILWILCFQCSKPSPMNLILFENNVPFCPIFASLCPLLPWFLGSC